jgi:hypothetical protein
LNVLFASEAVNDGKLVSAADICSAATKASNGPGVTPFFYDMMSDDFLQRAKAKLQALPSSTCHAVDQHLEQHLLVARLFWVMHNQPLSLYNDTLRKQMAYQQGVSLYKMLFPGPPKKPRRVSGEKTQ